MDDSSNDYFMRILSENLSDADVQQLFTLHGEAEFPNSLNNIESEEKLVIRFNSRNKLMRTMVMIHARLDEIKKDIVLINDLPDDCLTYIFSFLPISDKLNIERVCKRWRELSEKGWVYTRAINLPGEFPKNQLDVIFQRCGRFLRKLTIKIQPNCINFFPLIMEFCQLNRLEDIHVTLRRTSNIEIRQHSRNLIKLFENSRALRNVRLEGELDHYDIEYLDMLASLDLRKLEVLQFVQEWWTFGIRLDDFPNLTQVCFWGISVFAEDEKIYESLKGLESIEMQSCVISTSFFENMKFFTNLKKLDLRYNAPDDLEKEHFLGIIENCRNIKILHLPDCPWIDSCFQDLGKIPSLISLSFYRYYTMIDGTSIEYLTNLRDLEIKGYPGQGIDSPDGLLRLIIHSVKLQNLTLHVCAVDQSLRERISNIFVQGLRTIPLHLTFIIDRRAGEDAEPASTYDGPEHALLEVNVKRQMLGPQW